MEAGFELSLQTSFLMCSSAHGTLGFITRYQSINVKFFELPQCFYAIVRVFVIYSHYDDGISSKELNKDQAFGSTSLLGSLFF